MDGNTKILTHGPQWIPPVIVKMPLPFDRQSGVSENDDTAVPVFHGTFHLGNDNADIAKVR